jgi:Raf kinase inhibitor-like YbhB/YbcL family protein
MDTKQRIIPVCYLAVILVISSCGPRQSMEPTLTPESTSTPTSTPEPTSTPTLTPEPTPTPIPPFILASTAFKDGETIPLKYAYLMSGQCHGENYSPPLFWTGTPAGTQSFAVTMYDPDGGNWVHWVQFNIPSDQSDLPEAVGGPSIGIKGVNSFHKVRYGGPCPPSGTHNYVFTLYALDTLLSLSQGATKAQVDAAMQGHILQQAQLTGKRSY